MIQYSPRIVNTLRVIEMIAFVPYLTLIETNRYPFKHTKCADFVRLKMQVLCSFSLR